MDNEKEEREDFMFDMMETHHEELVEAIKSIKPKDSDNSEVFDKLNAAVEFLTKKLEVLQSPKIVVEKTEVNQKETVNLLKELIVEIKALKPEKKEYTFEIVRDDFGHIKSVNVKQ
jgi:predicted nuclease with TOPRIM domain